jgi:hypothetical protein
MKKVLIILFFVVLLGGIAYVLIRNPELFNRIYLWIIGLFGIITWPFRKLWDWMNTGDELKEVEKSNEALKQDLVRIKRELALAKRKLDEERSKNKLRIEQLESKIRREDQIGHSIQQELAVLKKQTPEQFRDSLSPDERRKIEEDIWKEVDFGL